MQKGKKKTKLVALAIPTTPLQLASFLRTDMQFWFSRVAEASMNRPIANRTAQQRPRIPEMSYRACGGYQVFWGPKSK